MKFTCEKSLLTQAVAIASRCAASKSPIPALEGLLIEAGESVRVTGYDLKKGIYTSFPADVEETGAIVLSAKLFGEIVRSLPDGVVTVETGAGMSASITCGASDFSILGSDAGEYPELPSVDRQNAIVLPQDILSKMIRQTLFAVSDNESRPVYTGALFEVKDDTLVVVAVDGYRLALRREKIESGELENCTFIVPGAALSDVEKLCGGEESVEITVGSKHISFAVGDTVLVSRRLEGEFLNYEKSIPGEFGTLAEADREELNQIVTRVSLVIDEKTKHPLKMSVKDGILGISCQTGRGRAADQCAVKVTGTDGIVIGFNNRYLLDALKAAPADTVRIGLNTASSPCVILPADGGDSFSYMILPVRLRADA